MHSTDNLDDGYLGSGTRLRRSIAKHGKEKHERAIVEMCTSRQQLKQREREIIEPFIIQSDLLCMNIALGGEGGWDHVNSVRNGQIPDDVRKKISDAKRGQTFTEQHRIRLSESQRGTKSYWFGRHHTGEAKLAIGRKNSLVTDDDVSDMREAFKNGESRRSIQERYGLAKSTVNNILSGRRR